MTFHPKQAGNSPRLLQQESTFDPRVFWCVNGFLFTFLLGFIIWCARGGAEKVSIYLTREAAGLSDAEYVARVRERRERAAEEKKESPEHRRRTLKACFHRNKVCMVSDMRCFWEKNTAMVKSVTGVSSAFSGSCRTHVVFISDIIVSKLFFF
jgi:hypothetical protein